MARVELNDGWTAGGAVAGLQVTLHDFLRERGMWVVGEQAGEVHARQGSWLARVFGGRLARSAWLPKRAVVKLQPAAGGVGVRASIEAASPTGWLSPAVADKYRAYFARWMAGLKARLA